VPDEEQHNPASERGRRRLSAGVVLGVVLAGAAAGWWFGTRPSPAEEAARRFVEATMSGDYSAVAPYLSNATAASAGYSTAAKHDFVLRWQRFLTAEYEDPTVARFAVYAYAREGSRVARVRVQLIDDSDEVLSFIREDQPAFGRSWIVMVFEGGRWKFDAARTIDRQIINPTYCADEMCLKD
jgi:hypothetical protein